MSIAIIVHGGAWAIPDNEVAPHRNGCRNARNAGWDILAAGGSAMDAVEAAVRILEDDPTYDAGVGSVLNRGGFVELDAAVMDGDQLLYGSVAGVRRVRNPISLARHVLNSPAGMLVAEGAEQFAVKRGIKLCDPEDLIVDREFAIYQDLVRTYDESKDTGATPPPGERNAAIQAGGWPAPSMDRPGDTVGCVAIDSHGWVVAGTSTGGTGHKLVGRVGDAPLLGGGLYAMNELGGCSTTGWGESIMRILLAKTAVDYLADDCHPQIAADRAIQRLADRGKGTAGCILLDRHGRLGWAFNTPRMAHAWRTADGRDGDGV